MQRESSHSAGTKFFKLNYDEVMEKLREYAKRAIERGAKLVVLIGSLAKGNYTAFSDADILIISDDVPERPIDRLKDYIDPSMPIDVEPRIYTTKEVINMAIRESRAIIEAIEQGKILAGDSNLLNELKKAIAMRNTIEKVIEEYNKYRAPEVEAILESINNEELKVIFEGSFCFTCGLYDYVDDFKLELEDAGIKTEIKEIIEDFPKGVTITFKIKRKQ